MCSTASLSISAMNWLISPVSSIPQKYAINSSISNEDFTRELFAPFVTAGNVKDKNGELLELNKSRVSRLLAGKDDVPSAMRNALSMLDIAERTAEGFSDFLADNIDAHRHDDLVADVSQLAGSVLTKRAKSNDISMFLAEVFIEAVKINNVAIDNKDAIIWNNGSNSIEIVEGDANVDKSKCPDCIKYYGVHIPAYYYASDGKCYWNIARIKERLTDECDSNFVPP